MANEVKISITNHITEKKWALSTYNPTEGVVGAPEYLVPTYKMKVSGCLSDFKVIRFGIKRTNIEPPPTKRHCKLGSFNENTYSAVWLPSYKVHSGPGSIPGACQLYKNFLIHEGSSDPSDAWGSYGCIEVVGENEWFRFLTEVQKQSGADNFELSNEKKINVHIQQAVAPLGILI